MKKERRSDGGSGEAATAACEGAGGRRMSQCEWVGVRVMKWNGEWGCGQAWSSCLGSLQGTRAPIATGKKQKPPKPWFYTKWESRKLMVNGSRLTRILHIWQLHSPSFKLKMLLPGDAKPSCWVHSLLGTALWSNPGSRRALEREGLIEHSPQPPWNSFPYWVMITIKPEPSVMAEQQLNYRAGRWGKAGVWLPGNQRGQRKPEKRQEWKLQLHPNLRKGRNGDTPPKENHVAIKFHSLSNP